ncbi:hypothetical protein N7462_003911 [Penicillium macrosclerotiorum]|uniref:uncharacterized protein n=1 Tax=Penicillium macrosclerotiorum TaxID=303699 RepID=UPI002546EB98|nr:uncharacterized protein N7462_003911 [Penicillium macrosclerotiorum]KAJ5689519.1 hypothetical protein N7462_003911 [Penicillium macrosclerotiorum]
MFSRRKRSSSHHQPLSTSASQSAQSAASHAFLKSQPSSSSLSSAAAAAALRNLTPTPTPIENVQTKRMVQRRASTQSTVNPAAGRRSASVSGPLRRTNSSSSMTARTFREPSPHRPSTSSGPVDRPGNSPVNVPPLPSLPSQYASRRTPNRRAASMEPSIRSSPTSPPRSGAGWTNVDRGLEGGASISPTTHHRVSSLSTVPESDRPSSRSSVNFSYPRGARPNSPTLATESQPMSLNAAADQDVSSPKAPSPQQTISEHPVNVGQRRQGTEIAEGSHSMNTVGNAVAAAQAVSMLKGGPGADPTHARAERVDHEASVTSPTASRADRAPASTAVAGSEAEHPASRPVLERWPSTVPEEQEPEEVGLNTPIVTGPRLPGASPAIDRDDTLSTPQPSPQPSPKAERQHTPQQQDAHLRQSNSPGRSARFAKWLSVTAAGDQVHEPPPRSVSPVKSAMKHPRGNSLSPDRNVNVAGRVIHPASEISDGTSVASDEGARVGVRKRPVKVSFDDEAEIVGVAASPPTSPEDYLPESPPSKPKSRMSWLGVGRKKTSPLDFSTGDDDFDEVMKPRPALPSFGSVRANRDGASHAPPIPEFSDNESTTSSEDQGVVTAGTSFSNDHALGGLLPKVQAKETQQPHDVKSVEQLSVIGKPSLSQEKSASGVKVDGVAIGGLAEQRPLAGVNATLPPPSIAVEPATPPVDSDRPSFEQRSSRSSLEQYHIPGGFPASGSDRNLRASASANSTQMAQPVASAVPKLDDVDTEGESGDSVYSDAPEDFDGDGFGSINAIVDSRSTPRSTGTLGASSESRDTTPKASGRIAAVDGQSRDITDQAFDEARSLTPTQESVDRQAENSPVSPAVHTGFDSRYPPMPIRSKIAPSTLQNGITQSEINRQKRPMSVDAHGTSDMQDSRFSSNSCSPKSGKPNARPVSLGPAFQMRGNSGGGSAGFPSSLRRTTSNGSDSSSSFKRASNSTRGDGPISMRRTMRVSPINTRIPSEHTDSPTERRPLSADSGMGTGTMRKTLRGPGGEGDRYSFFSTNKKAPRARFTKAPPKSMRPSRFADSDGEGDEAQPQIFRSRFADSSDEEAGDNSMRPVRGIPRRRGAHDGDSTELEDSSEEDRHQRAPVVAAPLPNRTPPASRDKNAPNMSGFAAVARQRGMSQRELEEFLMQPPRGRKPGLLTRLGIKKAKNSDNRIRKADVESPSRRDTPLERSRFEREQLREEPSLNGNRGVVTTVTAGSPEPASPSRLVKRLSKRQPGGGDHWPLQPEPRIDASEPIPEHSQCLPTSPLQTTKPEAPAENTERNGSAAINGAGASGMVAAIKERHSLQTAEPGQDINDAASDITSTTAEEPNVSARDVVIAGSGRKKRFPLLRKAFGLRA